MLRPGPRPTRLPLVLLVATAALLGCDRSGEAPAAPPEPGLVPPPPIELPTSGDPGRGRPASPGPRGATPRGLGPAAPAAAAVSATPAGDPPASAAPDATGPGLSLFPRLPLVPAADPATAPAADPADPGGPPPDGPGAELAARLLATVAQVRTVAPEVDRAVAWDRAATAEADYVLFLRRAQVRFGTLPVLLEGGRPGEAATALLAAIQDLDSHALDAAPYDLPRVQAALERLAPLALATEEQRRGPFTDDAGHALWEAALLALGGADPAAVAARAAAVDDRKAALERLPLVRRWLIDAATAEGAWQEAQASADVLLVRTFVRYAMDFRYLRRTDPYRAPDVLADRLSEVETEVLDHLAAARDDMPGMLAALRPTNPIYDQARAFLPELRALVAAPEALRPPQFHAKRWIRKGIIGPDVAQLRERLRAEGFEPGPPGDRYDAPLQAAIIAFQEVRGLAPVGEVGPQSRTVLNVTMEHRLRQLELSLQRWRENAVGHATGRFVRINIPEFELQLWQDGKIVRRHKVIVGNGALHTDLLTGTIGYLNRTHLLQSALYKIVLNPFWRVPRRIAVHEIGPEAESDPEYMKEKGFKLVSTGGEPMYVQAPGPKNPLGQVKFLFQNDHLLYLHDTDNKWLFRETQRDFSHGCIRVDQPLDLAYALAEATGTPRAQVEGLLRTGRELGVDLRPAIPIYIDYNTAGVDESGRLLLLPDVYLFDRDALKGDLPVNDRRPMKPSELERAKQKLRDKAKKS